MNPDASRFEKKKKFHPSAESQPGTFRMASEWTMSPYPTKTLLHQTKAAHLPDTSQCLKVLHTAVLHHVHHRIIGGIWLQEKLSPPILCVIFSNSCHVSSQQPHQRQHFREGEGTQGQAVPMPRTCSPHDLTCSSETWEWKKKNTKQKMNK